MHFVGVRDEGSVLVAMLQIPPSSRRDQEDTAMIVWIDIVLSELARCPQQQSQR